MDKLIITVGVVCLLGCVQSYNKDIIEMYTSKFTGQAVYYGKSEDGTCSFGPDLPSVAKSSYIRHFVGLNAKQYQGSISCGMCLRVCEGRSVKIDLETGPYGTRLQCDLRATTVVRGTGEGEGGTPITEDFVAFVNNVCGGCEDGGIDIADDGEGQWQVEIEAIQCPVEDTKIEYRFEGSDEWYLRLQIRNTRVPVQEVSLVRNGVEEPMKRTSDGFWEHADGRLSAPLHIKMTAVTDEVVDDVISSIGHGEIQAGQNGVQFKFDWDLPGK